MKDYIKAKKYLTMKMKLTFYWLIVFVTMTTPVFSHVKDKNDISTARGEDMKKGKKEKSWYFISIYIINIFSFHLIPVVVAISKAFATMATAHFSTQFSHSCIINFFPSFF